jgi:hypothetical protein
MPSSVRLPNSLKAGRALGLRAQVDQRAGHQLERGLQRLVPRGVARDQHPASPLGAIGRRHEHRRMHVAHAARAPARHALGGGAHRGGGVVDHPGAGRQRAGQRLEHGVDRGVVGQREVDALGAAHRSGHGGAGGDARRSLAASACALAALRFHARTVRPLARAR